MINIVITAAGHGSRFVSSGLYEDPKAFIPVNGKRMIQLVIENLLGSKNKSDYNFIIILLREFQEKYGDEIESICKNLCYSYQILYIDKVTEGMACTGLLCKHLINNDQQVVITDSDHIADKNHIYNGIEYFNKYHYDGGFWCFINNSPKFSYVRLDSNNNVVEIAEKVVISNFANTGSYYFSRGHYFVKYAQEMINRKSKTNNEYYLSKVYDGALIVD